MHVLSGVPTPLQVPPQAGGEQVPKASSPALWASSVGGCRLLNLRACGPLPPLNAAAGTLPRPAGKRRIRADFGPSLTWNLGTGLSAQAPTPFPEATPHSAETLNTLC